MNFDYKSRVDIQISSIQTNIRQLQESAVILGLDRLSSKLHTIDMDINNLKFFLKMERELKQHDNR